MSPVVLSGFMLSIDVCLWQTTAESGRQTERDSWIDRHRQPKPQMRLRQTGCKRVGNLYFRYYNYFLSTATHGKHQHRGQ